VHQRRHAPVRVDRQVLGLLGVAEEAHGHVLVLEAEFLEHPDAAGGARGTDAVEADHGRVLPERGARPPAYRDRPAPGAMPAARPEIAPDQPLAAPFCPPPGWT